MGGFRHSRKGILPDRTIGHHGVGRTTGRVAETWEEVVRVNARSKLESCRCGLADPNDGNGSVCAGHDWLRPADSVEKVGAVPVPSREAEKMSD